MGKPKSIKDKIIELYLSGKPYSEISKELKCSKGTISFHCAKIRIKTEKFDYHNWRKSSDNKKHINAYKKWKDSFDETNKQKILSEPYENLKYERLRKRVIYEQEGKCNKCGITEWNGKPITLELEHKDGNNDNDSRENLEAICPNCHSQTKTWRGKNKNDRRNKVSDDVLLISILRNKFNFRKALIDVGLAAKGGNYNRCHRLKNGIIAGGENNITKM